MILCCSSSWLSCLLPTPHVRAFFKSSTTSAATPITPAHMPWRVREHWGSAWSAKRPREEDGNAHAKHASVSADHPVFQPTAKPTPARAPRLVPTHSIASLHSHSHASASNTQPLSLHLHPALSPPQRWTQGREPACRCCSTNFGPGLAAYRTSQESRLH